MDKIIALSNIDNFVKNILNQYNELEIFKKSVDNKINELKSSFLTVSVKNGLLDDDPFKIKWNIPDNFADFLKDSLNKNSEIYRKNDTFWKLDGTIHTKNTLESSCSVSNDEFYSDKWRLIATEGEFDILLSTMGYNNVPNDVKSKYLDLVPVCEIKSIRLNTSNNIPLNASTNSIDSSFNKYNTLMGSNNISMIPSSTLARTTSSLSNATMNIRSTRNFPFTN